MVEILSALGGGVVAVICGFILQHFREKHQRGRETKKDTIEEFKELLEEVKGELDMTRLDNRAIHDQLRKCRDDCSDERARRRYVEHILRERGIPIPEEEEKEGAS